MPERTVSVSLVADMSNYLAGMQRGSAATSALGKNAQTTGDLTRSFIGKIGGSLNSLGNQVGGSVGAILSTVGQDIDQLSTKAFHLSTAFEVGGAAAVAAGIGLQELGSAQVQATDELNAAISAAGQVTGDYTNQINKAVSTAENFGFSATDTKTALTSLVTETGSTSKALSVMSVVTDLAAVKHQSLADAANEVSRVLAGTSGRILTQYGIALSGVGTKAQQGSEAIQELGVKLNGQATASVQNFGSQVDIVKTKIEDFIDDAAQPAGVVLEGVGVAASILGGVLDVLRYRASLVAAAQTAANVAAAASVPALDAEATAATTASVSLGSTGLGASVAALATGPAGIAVLAAGALYAVSALGTMSDAAANNVITFKSASDAAAAYNKQVSLVSDPLPGFAGNATTKRGSALQLTTGANAGFGQFFTSVGLGGLNSDYQGAADTISKIDASMAKLVADGHASTAAAEFDKWQTAAKQLNIPLSTLNTEFPSYTSALQTYGSNASDASANINTLSGSEYAAAENARELKSATDDAEKSLSTFGSTQQSAQSAEAGFYSAIDAATASIKTNKQNIDDSTAAGRANNQALYGVASAANALAEANLKNKTPLADVIASAKSAQQQFIGLAEQMGYSAQQAQKLASQLIQIPKNIVPTVVVDGLDVASTNVQKLQDQLDALGKKSPTSGGYVAGLTVLDNGITMRAGGGTVRQGEITMVGEQGPELAVFPPGTRIFPNGQHPAPTNYTTAPDSSSQSAMPPLSIVVNVNGAMASDPHAVARVTTTAIRKAVKAGVVSKTWTTI